MRPINGKMANIKIGTGKSVHLVHSYEGRGGFYWYVECRIQCSKGDIKITEDEITCKVCLKDERST